MKLENKTAVIVGAGRGMGRAIALEFAKEGANLVLAAPELDQVEAVAAEVTALGRAALPLQVDIREKSQVDAMAAAALDRFGAVEILVNSGGVAVHNAIPDIKESDWDFTMEVNARGTFLTTQAFFQHMCDRRQGHIVNIVSTAAQSGKAKVGAYAASKWAQMGFTQTTDAEGVAFNVKATAILPGAADTQQRAENHVDDREKLLRAEDIAEYVTFIVTRPSRVYIAEASIVSQHMKPLPPSINLKEGI